MLFDKILYSVDLFEFFVLNQKFRLTLNIYFFKFFLNSMFFWIYFIIAIYHSYLSIFLIIALKERILLTDFFFIKFDFLNITFNITMLDFL